MKYYICEYHITLELELKNHYSTILLQLHPPKCNFYVTTHYKYGDLINKNSCKKKANCLIVAP